MLGVLIYHLGLGLPGGYAGVDVFFVVSGYLVTRIIESEVRAGNFSYQHFWERRLRRLLPALAVMLGVTLGVGWLTLLPEHYQELGLTLAAQPLIATNFVFWYRVKDGYFVDPPEIRPTLHIWSLAVEEQFYLLSPALMVLAYRWLGGRRLTPMFFLLAIASWAVSAGLSASHPKFAFFLPFTRAFELLVGALVWRLPNLRSRRVAAGLGALGLAGVWATMAGLPAQVVFPGWIAVLPCVSTAALLLAGRNHDHWVARLLSSRALVGLGMISYSVYLWHWPLISYWNYVQLPTQLAQRLLLAGVSILLGYISWRWIERPVREKRCFATSQALTHMTLVCSLVALGIGGWLWYGEGAPGRWSKTVRDSLLTSQMSSFPNAPTLRDLEKGSVPKFGSSRPGSPMLVVWGDSHALVLLDGIDEMARQRDIQGRSFTTYGRPPFDYPFEDPTMRQEQRRRCELIQRYLLQQRPALVLLAFHWGGYDLELARPGLTELSAFLRQHQLRFRMVLDVPAQEVLPLRAVAIWQSWGRDPSGIGISQGDHRRVAAPFQRLLSAVGFPAGTWIDSGAPLLSSDRIYSVYRDRECLYHDTHHLSVAGSKRVAPAFEPDLTELVGLPPTP
ncbi:acyltransferase [bacterium]|nr:acyltransferase [bacterium]